MTAGAEYQFNKMVRLIQALTERTNSGDVTWQTTQPVGGPSGPAECYQVSLRHGTMDIWSEDNDGLHPFVFRLYGPNGDVVETISTSRNYEEPRHEVEEKIEELFTAVRRQVRNVDGLLDELLRDLE